MDKRAFSRAKEDLARAKQILEGMKVAIDLTTLAQSWSDFLTYTQRIFTRMRVATAQGPSKSWYDTIFNSRRTDELLSYVWHARNADEHGIDPITEAVHGRVGLKSKHGNRFVVDRLTIHNGQITMGPEFAKNVDVTFVPASIKLKAVRDRGITYNPPTSHLGDEFNDPTPISVATATLDYLERLINEAHEKFDKE